MFTLYHADCLGQPKNCLYPHRTEISDAASLAQAVSHDYVCAEFKDSYRSNSNFLCCNCLAFDFDNDHTDDPEKWVFPQQVLASFAGVTVGIHYSRNHLKEKRGRAPRPKFHVMFEIDPITDPRELRNSNSVLRNCSPSLIGTQWIRQGFSSVPRLRRWNSIRAFSR